MSEARLPPPTAALSVVKLLALAWFLLQAPTDRDQMIKVLHWVADVFSGPVKGWPLDFGRPLHEAEDEIAGSRQAAAWTRQLADQLEVFKDRLPK
jgi:hypothetical protein